MHYKAVPTISDLSQPLAPDTEFMYFPRIKCLDCPGKLYTPGPGITVENFKIHLENRIHREKVEERRRSKFVLPNMQEPAPAPQKKSPRPSKPRQDTLIGLSSLYGVENREMGKTGQGETFI